MLSPRTISSVYTDGACTGNPGPGGWGVVVYFGDGSVYEMGGSEAQTTNNRMEMVAAIAALKLLATTGQTQPVTLYTDSEYLKKGITQWMKGWKKKGWKTSTGNPVLNQDLWETLDQLNSSQLHWEHVRGHAGNEGNERCDAIARSFAQGKTPTLQQSPISDLLATQTPQTPYSNAIQSSRVPSNLPNSDLAMNDTISLSPAETAGQVSGEVRVSQLRNLLEALRIADEISNKGYLITSSELADLMDIHTSAVTSRGDNWVWRNWVVSRVRREGNQILWQLERVD